VAAGESVLCLRCADMRHGQAEALLPMVADAMAEAGLPPAALDCVAVARGPGSFTGIRIGLAAAHGIALALERPLLGVTSFEAAAALAEHGETGRFLLVAIESRRRDFYAQLFSPRHESLTEPAAVMPEALGPTVAAAIGEAPLTIVGDAAVDAAAALFDRPRTTIADLPPLALGVVRVGLRHWRRGEQDRRVRPFYLRPPDVTLARPADGR
jgi:tRNA threonylcarbamoyladenosine biosynthesis protein TsaB